MSDKSNIEWTEATWNPVAGCSIVSPGCTNCYAMKLAGTRLRDQVRYKGLTVDSKAGPVWNGEVRFIEEVLTTPIHWRKPRMIFVNSMSDMFHENLPDEVLDKIFAVMALCPQHTFQILTKRAERMQAYLSAARAHPVALAALDQTFRSMAESPRSNIGKGCIMQGDICHLKTWPLPNVWLGVSCEDQTRADERIPHLLRTPTAVRFISAEPLLGAIDLTKICLIKKKTGPDVSCDSLRGWLGNGLPNATHLDWVIVGGESGKGARPMHPDWARSLQAQCAEAGVHFFFKQWGNWMPIDEWSGHQGSGKFLREDAVAKDGGWLAADLIPQDHGAHRMRHVGKGKAGRLLDGREHSAMPVKTA